MATYYIPANTHSDSGTVFQGIIPDLSGTDGDDIYIDSKDTHGYPTLGNYLSTSGSDKYYLALDVDAKNRVEHPYLEGGGYPYLENFNINTDKIYLPPGVNGSDIAFWGFNHLYYHNNKEIKADVKLVYDPHRAIRDVFAPSLYSMSYIEDGIFIGGGVSDQYPYLSIEDNKRISNLTGPPKSVEAFKNREKDPDGYNQWLQQITNIVLQKFPDFKYTVDRLAYVYFNSRDIHKLKNRIFLSNGESAFNTSSNQSNEESKNETSNGDEQQIADNINDVIVGIKYLLDGIKDYDGNLHGYLGNAPTTVTYSYKFQGQLDVNSDGTIEAVFTNSISGRWVTSSIDPITGAFDYTKHGVGGTTRIVGIYQDPLVANGTVEKDSVFDGSRTFINDLKLDNLILKTVGDFDSDGFQEVYWSKVDNSAYLRAVMHADGNIQYANYQNLQQMTDYLTGHGFADTVALIA